MSADFYVKQNDLAPIISGTLTDEDGAAVDIAGATLALTMTPMDGTTAKVDGAAASNDQNGDAATAEANGTKGAWSYAWVAGDTDTAGYFNVEVQVTYDDGTPETFPNDGYVVVKITAELG